MFRPIVYFWNKKSFYSFSKLSTSLLGVGDVAKKTLKHYQKKKKNPAPLFKSKM